MEFAPPQPPLLEGADDSYGVASPWVELSSDGAAQAEPT